MPNMSYIELHAMTIRDIDHLLKTYMHKVEMESKAYKQRG
jgi:hypothetical protein